MSERDMWHSLSTTTAKAHDLCRCSVNNGLTGVTGCRKREITPSTPTLLNKRHENQELFQCRVTNTGQMGLYNK